MPCPDLHRLPSSLGLFAHPSFSVSWLRHKSWGGVSIYVDTLSILVTLLPLLFFFLRILGSSPWEPGIVLTTRLLKETPHRDSSKRLPKETPCERLARDSSTPRERLLDSSELLTRDSLQRLLAETPRERLLARNSS